jgi:hypothetical protein
MQQSAILHPVFVQVALTFCLLLATAWSRTRSLQQGEVKMRDVALGQKGWPARVQQIANAYQNQLELPVLFYVACALALVLGKVDMVMVALAWLFVLTRLAHAAVHVTSNRVPSRFQAFAAGVIALIGLWGVLAVRVLG